MGDTAGQHRCADCDTRGPDVVERGAPFGPLCGTCWEGVQNLSDNEDALADGAAAPPLGADPRCRHCNRLQARYETPYNRWVLLEPRILVPWQIVPVGHRWVVTPDDKAMNTRERPLSLDKTCRIRIPHHLVCPADEPPADTLDPFFHALYEENLRNWDTWDPPDDCDGPYTFDPDGDDPD
ncbi:DUF6083 domain-containing protein [Streptomyces sp. NPDC048172]|uniref:DUF6083 domain-containing protein n=1 Tax=Streptomyces sp. NPDC048172 TaxID=3365505 RepID=UPI003723A419